MNINELTLTFALFLIGAYGLIRSQNIIKALICFSLLDTSLVLLYLKHASPPDSRPAIMDALTPISTMTDPLPQAILFTAIVINAAITALGLIMSIKLFHYYGSLKWSDLFPRKD